MKNKDYRKAKNILILGPLSLCDKTKPLSNIDLVIFVDGGLKHKPAFDHIKSVTIGDNDSALTDDSQFTHLASKDKDYTDLELALEFLTNNTLPDNVILDGFYGERLDHQLAVFSSLSRFNTESDVKTIINYKHGLIELIKSSSHSFQHNGEFSIMPTSKQNIGINGNAKFKSNMKVYSAYSGNLISNIASGKVEIKSDGLYFLHLCD